MDLLERFLNYVKIDTQSSEDSNETPSTKKQYNLLNLLKKELDELKVENSIDEFGRLYAYVPGNNNYKTILLCAHIDTALECSGANVNPQIIKNYDCSDVKLGNTNYILSPLEFNKLSELRGKTLITTDGTTLLGADDKAGLAIIMSTLEKVLKLPIDARKPMSILFTPDEEVGRGPEHFNKEKTKADFGYTIDGSDPKYISKENFNAKSIDVQIKGKSIHPGDAKGIMINAAMLLSEFIQMLPENEVPSKTCGYEGFHHLTSINGTVEFGRATFILRNHDSKILQRQVEDFEKVKDALISKYPLARINLNVKDQYSNMIEIIVKNPDVIETIENVYNRLDIPFEYEPTRGGTDGATFSFMGLPCPNLGTGSYNHHGRLEFAVLEEMDTMVQICFNLFSL